jgi:tripartite-type tricarboxylate transporter receptor subunit TctC
MDPAVVKVLHDAFAKTLQDPKVLETLDKFYQPVMYMNTVDYTQYASRTLQQEKATIERLRVVGKLPPY